MSSAAGVWVFVQSLIACLLLSCVGYGGEQAPLRQELPLDSWSFQPGTRVDAEPSPSDWTPVKLPCLWAPMWRGHVPRTGKPWEKRDLNDVDSGWFETRVGVPPEWRGKRLCLDLLGVQCDAIVWVNGQRLADRRRPSDVIGPDGRVDITRAATPGQEAHVRLWVTRWWEGTQNQREKDAFRDTAIRHMAASRWYKGEEAARRGISAGIADSVTLRAVPVEAEIEGVRVETSFREKKLRVHVDYVPRAALAGARFEVQVAELDGGTGGLPASTLPVRSGAPLGEVHRQTIAIPWERPHLWEIGAPHLYALRVALLDGQGKAIDRFPPVRFGFREVWTEGKLLMLNGHPIRLRMAPFVGDLGHLLFYEGMGFDAIEFQPNPGFWYGPGLFPSGAAQAGTQELLDAADERGWAVLMPVPSVSGVRDRLAEAPTRERSLRDTRSWLRRLDRQNRPSILMWCPSMNTALNLDPARLGRRPTATPPAWYAMSEQLVKSLDPTRLVFHHQGGQTGDVEMTNLYPNFMPLQEGEEFLSAWSQGGEKPWGAVEYQHPVILDFFKFPNLPIFTEYCAIYLGDRAYAAEKDDYVQAALDTLKQLDARNAKGPMQAAELFVRAEHAQRVGEWTGYYDLMCLFIRSTHRSWRAWGQNGGLFPWICLDAGFGVPPKDALARADEKLKERPAWANPIYDVYREISQPLLVFIGGPRERFTAKDHSFYAGEEVERTIIVVWDGPGSAKVKVDWVLEVGAKAIAQGAEQFALTPGAIEKRPVHLRMPPVSARTAGELKIAAFDEGGAPLAADRLQLTVFPPVPRPAAWASRWTILDPAGKSAPELTKLGLRPKPLQPGDPLTGTDVLVIGREALRGKVRLPFTLEDVQRGLRVLFLEQDIESLEALGFRAQDVSPRYVFPRVKSHPVLAGIEPQDLINWRGEGALLPPTSEGMRVWPWAHAPHWGNTGSVASVAIETPHRGAFTPILECEFDLAYSPLLEWRDGRGRVLFCQLDLTGRIGCEPAADLLAGNLLRYLDQPAPQSQDRSIVFLGDEKAASFIRGLGLELASSSAEALPRLSPASQVVVIGPENLSGIHTNEGKLRSFVRSGGVVLVLPQGGQQWSSAALPWGIRVAPRKVTRILPESASPLLAGIGPQLLHFRTFLEVQSFSQVPPGSERLLDGLLLKVGEGEGFWLFSQVDWRPLFDGSDNLRRTRWNLARLYRQLLTNCGARTEARLGRQFLAPVRYAPIVDVTLWQVAVNPPEIPVETATVQDVEGAHIQLGTRVALPALGRALEGDAWLEDPHAPAWRFRGADKNGWVDFSALTPHKVGKVGYAVTCLYSSVPRDASFALDSDWWFILRVNGKVRVDQSRDGRIPGPPRKGAVRVKVPLQAGWNRVEMKVASGGSGFGFWCQVSDPGDLRVSPSVAPPARAPAEVPAKGDLLAEPLVQEASPFYVEPLADCDDPYGFTPW